VSVVGGVAATRVALMKLFLSSGTEQSKNFLGCIAQLALAGCFGYGAFMLSVLIETRNDEEGLARTLASLIGGAVEGVVREVIVCDAGSSDQTHHVAEHAGCHYLANAPLAAGIRQAKSEWLLIVEPGARLREGWIEAVVAHAGSATGAACFTRARQSQAPFLSRIFAGRRPLADGLVVTKRQAQSLARGEGAGAAIARAVSPRRIDAEILVAPLKPRG
jgi:hypothetical protein